MPTNRLTARAVAQAKPRDKAYKMGDGNGLYLAVLPSESKSWRMAYRLAGKQQTHVIGPYPEIALADARAACLEARKAIREGGRPARNLSDGMTVKEGIYKYWKNREGVTEGYWKDALAALDAYVIPVIGHRTLRSLTRADVMSALDPMDAAGKFVYVRRTRMWFSQVLDWAVEKGHADSNPAASIKTEKAFGSRKVKHFPALEPREMPEFLRVLSQQEPTIAVMATRFMMLTWVRTIEIRRAVWDDIDGDMWIIPADRMKGDRDHMIPLSTQAQALLNRLRLYRRSDVVFPSPSKLTSGLSENAVLAVIKRLGYKGRMTGHGFRSTASTWANEIYKARPDVTEMALAHAQGDATRAAYNRALYLDERRALLQAWADWLDNQAAENRASVVPISAIRQSAV